MIDPLRIRAAAGIGVLTCLACAQALANRSVIRMIATGGGGVVGGMTMWGASMASRGAATVFIAVMLLQAELRVVSACGLGR